MLYPPLLTATQCEDSDRIHVEFWEVCDGLPLGLDDRRVGVEDDVMQTVSKQRTGSERSDEVNKPDVLRVAARTQDEDHVVGEAVVAYRLAVLYTENVSK